MGNSMFSKRLIAALLPDSPLFYDLWPHIIRLTNSDSDFLNLALACKYFNSIAKRLTPARRSDQVKDRHIFEIEGGPDSARFTGLRLDPFMMKPLWYSWGADLAGFKTSELFREFCLLAGVKDPDHVYHQSTGLAGFTFVSEEGDVNFNCTWDPRDPGNHGFCLTFGCTGEYNKAKRLEDWFEKNGEYGEISKWTRRF